MLRLKKWGVCLWGLRRRELSCLKKDLAVGATAQGFLSTSTTITFQHVDYPDSTTCNTYVRQDDASVMADPRSGMAGFSNLASLSGVVNVHSRSHARLFRDRHVRSCDNTPKRSVPCTPSENPITLTQNGDPDLLPPTRDLRLPVHSRPLPNLTVNPDNGILHRGVFLSE